MIGIVSGKIEEQIIREFFQLFKTPWEFYDNNQAYEVILVIGQDIPDTDAKCVIVYGCNKTELDDESITDCTPQETGNLLKYKEIVLPVYRGFLTFSSASEPLVRVESTNQIVGYKQRSNKDKEFVRIGYDLFKEIDFLLSRGQPTEHSLFPTLEMHISILRRLILNAGVPLIEIPPLPGDCGFIACLTHDVDFVGIRRHKFDRTFFGFLYRALVHSPLQVAKGNIQFVKMIRNFKAVFSLPFIYLGIARDFMVNFEKYIDIEKGQCSTFFIMPYKKKTGQDGPEGTSKGRETQYDIQDILPEINLLTANGCEIGVHGIDAWCDPSMGNQELQRIAHVIGDTAVGIRMHWLYYSEETPKHLEDAGFLYDSTSGYNDAIGFRAGTTQVFLPPGAKKLVEIPLHIMDSALFYSGRMNLTENDALSVTRKIFSIMKKFGGVLTINWHQRSIGPERLWDTFYIQLLSELKNNNVWFGTARQVAEWFNIRRSVSFEKVRFSGDKVHVKLLSDADNVDPKLVLRIHKPVNGQHEDNEPALEDKKYLDVPFSGQLETVVSLI